MILFRFEQSFQKSIDKNRFLWYNSTSKILDIIERYHIMIDLSKEDLEKLENNPELKALYEEACQRRAISAEKRRILQEQQEQEEREYAEYVLNFAHQTAKEAGGHFVTKEEYEKYMALKSDSSLKVD
jgi:hypothetical protein